MSNPTDRVWHPLNGSRDAVDRAHCHVRSLTSTVQGFVKDNAELFAIKEEPDGSEYVVKIPRVPVLPSDWGTLVTEVTNQTRQALDYLVYRLAISGGGNPDIDDTTFPIAIDCDDYWKVGKKSKINYRDRSLRGVDDRWKQEIDGLQPYNGTNPRGDPLAVLNRFNNRGKHRERGEPVLVLDLPDYRLFFDSREDVLNVIVRYGSDYVEIERAEIQTGSGGIIYAGKVGSIDVQAKDHTSDRAKVGIAFGLERAGLGDLGFLVTYVEGILVKFEPAFQPPANS
jgi:hypothetical protein